VGELVGFDDFGTFLGSHCISPWCDVC
jgi:hypothetical protein